MCWKETLTTDNTQADQSSTVAPGKEELGTTAITDIEDAVAATRRVLEVLEEPLSAQDSGDNGNQKTRSKASRRSTTAGKPSFRTKYINRCLQAFTNMGLLKRMPVELQKNYNVFVDKIIAQGIIASMISEGSLSDKEIFELDHAANDLKKAEIFLDILATKDLIGLCALREGLHATGQVDLLELIEGK